MALASHNIPSSPPTSNKSSAYKYFPEQYEPCDPAFNQHSAIVVIDNGLSITPAETTANRLLIIHMYTP